MLHDPQVLPPTLGRFYLESPRHIEKESRTLYGVHFDAGQLGLVVFPAVPHPPTLSGLRTGKTNETVLRRVSHRVSFGSSNILSAPRLNDDTRTILHLLSPCGQAELYRLGRIAAVRIFLSENDNLLALKSIINASRNYLSHLSAFGKKDYL